MSFGNIWCLLFLVYFYAEPLWARIDFETLTTRSYFVDKTGLIYEFFKNNNSVLLVCATQKFGKSVNIDMIKRFVQIEVNETTGIALNKTQTSGYRLFTNETLKLNISQHNDLIEEHLAEYPVIFLDFGSTGVNYSSTFDDMLELVRTDVSNCFKNYEWLCKIMEQTPKEGNSTNEKQIQMMKNAINKNLTVEEMRWSIYNLSEIVHSHFNKNVIVLIDEYAKINHEYISESRKPKGILAINELIGHMMQYLLKSYTNTTHLERVFITGMSRDWLQHHKTCHVKKMIRIVNFLKGNPFDYYYGLNEFEVDKLCDRLNITQPQKKGLEEIYGGESHFNSRVKVYCPFLVMKFLRDTKKNVSTYKKHKLKDHFLDSSTGTESAF